jgi:acetoacetyl-CoA synthetase
MSSITEGTILWQPSDAFRQSTTMHAYMQWLIEQRGVEVPDYARLWEWSVNNIEEFWRSIWDFFQVQASQSSEAVRHGEQMPGVRWFPGATLNFAEHIFRNATTERPALIFRSEKQGVTELSWQALHQQVASVAAALRNMGVVKGDRVVGYLPNIPEAVIAFLACASIGAIWSSCSPDFGAPSVIDRFQQIEPKVLFAVDGYHYGGKSFDRRPVTYDLQHALPTLEETILVSYADWDWEGTSVTHALRWDHIIATPGEHLPFEQVEFNHPLWVLYSSGTTGLPKPIVQSQGGILLEHLKGLGLHLDVTPHDRFFWFTTTGWMMWNFLVCGMLLGSTILLYDGSPSYPDKDVLWEFAAQTGMTIFGSGAAFFTACMRAELAPGTKYDLSTLKVVGSTASPLPPEGFQWVYERVKRDLLLASISGGTDVCTAFVGSCPLLPVAAGELQCRYLGASVHAFDVHGEPLIDETGELVVTKPMPSMPLFFWNDPDNQRYIESYFDTYHGVWRHGDWIKITPHGSVVIYGRSDSTIKRLGVRMGTSEIYRAVEDLPEIVDSLVVDVEVPGQGLYMPLFVVIKEGLPLDEALIGRITAKIRNGLSPRHVPDEILTIPEVPRTLSGKKLEVPVKRILSGVPIEKAANLDSMHNPQALRPFVAMAARLKEQREQSAGE